MSRSMRLKRLFLGCVIGFALVARLAFTLSVSLFGSLDGLADYANELSILVALVAAAWLTERLNSYYAKRTVLRLLEAGWVKWTAELEAQKASAAAEILKKVA